MEDPRWSRLIIIGVLLAVVAGGYFFLTNQFIFGKSKNPTSNQLSQTPQPQNTNQVVPNGVAQNTPDSQPGNPTPQVVVPNNRSAYEALVERNQQQVTTLPKTGAPIFLIGAAALSAIVTGLSLRKFPY